jgi:TonB family protein
LKTFFKIEWRGRNDLRLLAVRRTYRISRDQRRSRHRDVPERIQEKRYADVPAVLEKPIAAAPDKYILQVLRVEALLRGGQKDESLAEAKKIAAATSDSLALNDLAYVLADTGFAFDLAQAWAQKAVGQTEQSIANASLGSFEHKDLAAVGLMTAEWDTLGWVYFKQGDLAKAEKYVDASWQLGQYAAVADHLGQIYDQQGRHEAAIHMWRLAIASNSKYEDPKERLRNAGVPVSEPFSLSGRMAAKLGPISPAEELGKLRTIAMPAISEQDGSADFFLLISKQGIEDVQFISGSDAFKNAAHTIQAAKYEFPFPDAGPEKIVRSGVLSCSKYTPSCQLTMLPLSSTPIRSAPGQSSSPVLAPTLRTKVQPEYTRAAKEGRVEGTVLLSFVVNEDGIPEDISVVQPLGLGLDEKAKEAVAQWRFNPATKDGKPVRSAAKAEVNFRLLENYQ